MEVAHIPGARAVTRPPSWPYRRAMRLPLLALLVLLLAACSGAPAESPRCTPGASQPCVCAGGVPGAQECGPAGLAFGVCVCASADAGADVETVDASLPADSDTPTDVPAAPDVAARDAIVDRPADAAHDVPVADVDPLAGEVSATSITVRAEGYAWTMPLTQMCTVTSGTVSIGADFDRPERAVFTAMAPPGGPVVLSSGNGGSSVFDIHAEATRGMEYTAGSQRRVNVRVRGAPGGLALDVIALGCVVR